MSCFHPVTAWVTGTSKAGKKILTFKRPENYWSLEALELPCSKCIGCRIDRSKQWAVRCVYEASLHEDNCFITLTYGNDKLPHGGTLIKKDFQLFMRYLRRAYPEKEIKYYMCGEYGELNWRPHFHACLFGLDFEDKQLWKNIRGTRLYTSAKLARIWGKGHCVIGNVTFESAAYIARYVTKKITGEKAEDHYTRVDEKTGEIFQVLPEYTGMSLKDGGIAGNWYKQFKTDVYPQDKVIVGGKQMRTPKYFDKLLDREEPQQLVQVKIKRKAQALKTMADNTMERRLVRETCLKLRVNQFKRNLGEFD